MGLLLLLVLSSAALAVAAAAAATLDMMGLLHPLLSAMACLGRLYGR
jgi:hypothetical protein